MAVKNEIGNTYTYLTVIERAENSPEGRARWKCKCKCGKETIVLGKHLRSGNTKSCGCFQRERASESNMKRAGSLIGKKFGKLNVIEDAGFFTHINGRRSRLYKCLCDCGNYCEVQHQYLAFGDTTSCGCIRSKGEFQIEQLLKSKRIDYKREYMFDDLIDTFPLRFDFALFKNGTLQCLIEFQGEQHWQESNGYYHESIVRHDKMKKEYCEQNNIKLIYIYYKRDLNLTFKDLQLEGLYDEL